MGPPSQAIPPSLKDLTIDNITPNVHAINSTCPSPRLRFLLENLVTHLHSFARETRLTTSEWETAIQFLVETGKISTPGIREEFILLSDILGLSLLVDSINHPKPKSSSPSPAPSNPLQSSPQQEEEEEEQNERKRFTPTEGTVLGPFHIEESIAISQQIPTGNGSKISSDDSGTPMLVLCNVRDTSGKPIQGVKIDVWETDSKGFYDVQYQDNPSSSSQTTKEKQTTDGRAILESDHQGNFHCKAIVPVPYPIPDDGPVGKLLRKLGRHPYRPAHFHFMFRKAGYDNLVTALYVKGDPYERSDAVFGVKESLVVELGDYDEVYEQLAREYGIRDTARGTWTNTKVLRYDFVLVTEEEAREARHREGVKAMEESGVEGLRVVDGVPVPVG